MGERTEESNNQNNDRRMKTTKERALVKANAYYHEDRELRNFNSFYDGYIKGAEDALKGQWQEFTPDNVPWNTDILCRSDKGDVAVLQIVETRLPSGGRYLTTLPQVKCKIVAWMEIPQYQGKEADNG